MKLIAFSCVVVCLVAAPALLLAAQSSELAFAHFASAPAPKRFALAQDGRAAALLLDARDHAGVLRY